MLISSMTVGNCDTSTLRWLFTTCNPKNCGTWAVWRMWKSKHRASRQTMKAMSHRHILGKDSHFSIGDPILMAACLGKRKPIQWEPDWYMWTEGQTDITQVKGTHDYDVPKNVLLWDFFKLVPPYNAVSSLFCFCIFQTLSGDYLTKN